MAYMLAKLRNIRLEAVKQRLETDAQEHAAEGMFVEHLWQNIDDVNEVLFVFRVTDLDAARKSVARKHQEARKQNPNANLPTLTFVDEVPIFAHAR